MFRMTDRQAAGLANMEAFLGLRRPRTGFNDQEAFRSYWELVSDRCDRTARARAAETPATRAAQRARAQERVTAYYQDPEHLSAYARRYSERYRPSAQKLRQQLMAKAGNEALCDLVMQGLADRLDDHARAAELADLMQRQGRTAQAIRTKLRQRQFPTEVIACCLRDLTADTGSVLAVDAVTRKVHQLQRRGLSQRAMRSRLMGQASDAPVVQAAMLQALGGSGDAQALSRAHAKLSRKHTGRELTQRLVAKGFRYGEVVALLAELRAAAD